MAISKNWNKPSFSVPEASKKEMFIHPIDVNPHARKVGNFVCLLTMSTQPYHSGLELNAMRIMETSFAAISLQAQPMRFTFVYDGKRFAYTPDCRVIFRDNQCIYYEIKNEKAAESAKFKSRWKLCVNALEAQGQRLELFRESEILREPRYSNIRDLQAYRQVPPDTQITFPLDNFLRDGRRVALGQLVAMFPDPIYARQVICTMILRRHYTTDFDVPFCDRSPVWKVK